MSDVRRDITQPSGWAGMAVFGGLILILAGTFQIMAGLVGIFSDSYWQVPREELLMPLDYTVWAVAHLSLGVFALTAGVGIAAGRAWARTAGIALAGLSSLVNLLFLAAHPTWSTLVIAFDILVIYALAVHGDEVRT
jgi:hypothetical protein